MKLITMLVLLLSLVLTVSESYSQGKLTEENNFGPNPGNLRAFVYAPAIKSPKRPLLIALHGCSQSVNNLAAASGWNELANTYNFVVLYPSQNITNNTNRCFNWFNLEDLTGTRGELESLINMIKHTVDDYNIDTSLIYVYGVSAGAAMSVCLLANYPSYFKAGAILAGAPYKVAVNKLQGIKAMVKPIDKSPEEWAELIPADSHAIAYPKLIVYHGVKDKIVHIKNSYELIEQWTCLHKIDTIPDTEATNYPSNSVNRIAYTDTTGQEKVIFYKIDNLGHAIAIDPGEGRQQGGHSGLFTRDIDFFSTYYIAREFGLLHE